MLPFGKDPDFQVIKFLIKSWECIWIIWIWHEVPGVIELEIFGMIFFPMQIYGNIWVICPDLFCNFRVGKQEIKNHHTKSVSING